MTEGPPKIQKYSSQERELSRIEIREKMRDPSFLPTHDDIEHAFESRKDFRTFCEDEQTPTFEFLNKEFIESFGEYLAKQAKKLVVSKDNPVVILEVGAGNGRLTHFLQEKLDSIAPEVCKVIATDSGEWELENTFPVEKINHTDALQKYQPKIVVFSWMPYREDYTDNFRSTESVEEYLLIGEVGGCCGDPWRTWGYEDFSFDKEGENEPEPEKQQPPYEADNFSMEHIDDVTNTQICRTDSPGAYFHSSTVSFRRKN